MATIGGLSASTSSATGSNSIRGYGGLASGMDRDTLIEGMTAGTTNKITQQLQKKQKLEWKQEAVRTLSSTMIDFASKYTDSWASSTHLFGSMFWGRTNITTTGANSKYVSVTGNATAADAITVMGVKQLASNAKWSASQGVSDRTLTTGAIDFENVQNLVGKTLDFEFGGQSYSVTLAAKDASGNAYNYRTADEIQNAIKRQLADVKLKDADGNEITETLSDLLTISTSNGTGSAETITFKGTDKATYLADIDKSLRLKGGSAIEFLGFSSPNEEEKDKGYDLRASRTSPLSGELKNLETEFSDRVGGKEITFSYNGSSATVYMPSADDLKKSGNANKDKMEKIQESLQKQLDSAFGKNRVKVDLKVEDDTGVTKLTFKTTDPSQKDDKGNYKDDITSSLSIVDGHSDLILGAFNTKGTESNRVDLNAKLSESGLKLGSITFNQQEPDVVVKDKDGNIVKNDDGTEKTQAGRKYETIAINGKAIKVYEDDTMSALMNRINAESDVTVSYQSVADKFTFTSKEKGASGTIDLRQKFEDLGITLDPSLSTDEAKAKDDAEANAKALVNALFGAGASSANVAGKDAIVAVKYSGSDEVVELVRDSNSFTVDGLTIGVKGEFGYKEVTKTEGDKDITVKELDKDSEAVKVDARVDADKIVAGLKSMIEEYNSLIETVNKQLTQRPAKDYAPLTSAQKKEMSEEEIKLWEAKAKEGILYNDSDLRTLSSDLRFIVGGGNAQALKDMGITTSNLYSDNGKLALDEAKLRAMLELNPEKVEQVFTRNDGNSAFNGIATNLKNVMDKYVKTLGSWDAKGILIKKAGSESAPISLTENRMYKELQQINKLIDKLNVRLKSEKDRYIKQFTNLESLISQMNTQSSYLSQFGGF